MNDKRMCFHRLLVSKSISKSISAITHRILETPKNNRCTIFTCSIKEPRMSYSEFVSALLVKVPKVLFGYADLDQPRS
jgi:hypothetical protein